MALPVWGCPWHGLVTAGTLEPVPGKSLAWPMSGFQPYHYGSTHHVQVPGIAPIVRSTEEQAYDTAEGREWRNSAILSGRSPHLHGQQLSGWIYCAPDNSRWHVYWTDFANVPLGGGTWSGTVTVARFGEFGAATDERLFDYSLNPQQPSLSGVTNPAAVELHAVSLDGSKAILMLRTQEQALHAQATAIGFYLVEMSGGADDLAMNVSVLYSQAQTLGTSFGSFPTDSTSPDGSTVNAGAWSASLTGRVYACWFNGASVVPLTVDMNWSGNLDNPAPTGDPLGRTCTGTSSMTWQLQAGATVIDTLTASASQTIIARYDDPGTEGDQSQHDDSGDYTLNGDTRPYSSTGPLGGSVLPAVGPQLLNYWSSNPASLAGPGSAPIVMDDFERFALAYVHRYSNNLLGWAVRRLERGLNTLAIDYRPACHPGGVDAGTLTVAGDPGNNLVGYLPHGSYNPETGEVIRNSAVPACYV